MKPSRLDRFFEFLNQEVSLNIIQLLDRLIARIQRRVTLRTP